MNIVKSPNGWSCMPAAFATATGIPLSILLEAIGHDGSEIIFPDLLEPLCRRAFNNQELVFALLEFHWLATTYEVEPVSIVDEAHFFTLECEAPIAKLAPVLFDSIGVLAGVVKASGHRHAVAWDGAFCYDPTGFKYSLDRYEPEFYFRLSKIPVVE